MQQQILSKLIESNKSIHVVTKKFLKRLQGFIHQCFEKIRIVDKEDKKLTELYKARRLLRTKPYEESLLRLEEVEKQLSEQYSNEMYNKIMDEIKNVVKVKKGASILVNCGN